jgi:hypothetical protein
MREDLEILQGAVDRHIDSAPSLFPRLADHVEATENAKNFGWKPVVLKERES